MKKKNISMILVLISLMLIVVGCGVNDKEAFLKYKNEDMKQTNKHEEEFLESYNSVSGINYKDDKITLEELKKNAIPKVEAWVKSAETVKSKSSVVSDTHKFYLAGVKNAEKAIKVMIESMEKKDKDKTNQVTVILKQQREQMTQYQNKMKELSNKYDGKS